MEEMTMGRSQATPALIVHFFVPHLFVIKSRSVPGSAALPTWFTGEMIWSKLPLTREIQFLYLQRAGFPA
jgi:hypothetical protein